MAAPILWAPDIFWGSFCWKTPMPIKFLLLGGGGVCWGFLEGRVEVPILFSFRDTKGTPKNFFDKDFAELSGGLSGAICLETLVFMGNGQQAPRTGQKILWRCSCDFLALGFFFGS